MRQRNRLLGDSLYKIADLLFADAQSLFALIADFQQEWTATTSRLGRGRLRLRFVAAFWQGVLLQSLYRATRPPNVRATLIVTGSALLAGLSVGGLILWTTGDSPHVIVQLFISIPMFVSWAISDSELSYIARAASRL